MKNYEFLPHTADIQLEANGTTLPELFVHAAQGMFSYLAGGATGDVYTGPVEVTGVDTESLLVNWLSELLYIGTRNRAVLDTFRIRSLNGTTLSADVSGRRRVPGTPAAHEIKAVTYSGLRVRRTETGFSAAIIFDV